MTENANEKLFLIELLAECVEIDYTKVTIDKNVLNNLLHVCVKFQFLNFPELDVCEDDFIPTEGDFQKNVVNLKSGKSCLFSTRGLGPQVSSIPLSVTVLRRSRTPPDVVIGRTTVNLDSSFTSILQAPRSAENPGTVSKKITDEYTLADNNGAVVGKIKLFIRLSCFGPLIVTQFQISGDENNNYLFKGQDGTGKVSFTPSVSAALPAGTAGSWPGNAGVGSAYQGQMPRDSSGGIPPYGGSGLPQQGGMAPAACYPGMPPGVASGYMPGSGMPLGAAPGFGMRPCSAPGSGMASGYVPGSGMPPGSAPGYMPGTGMPPCVAPGYMPGFGMPPGAAAPGYMPQGISGPGGMGEGMPGSQAGGTYGMMPGYQPCGDGVMPGLPTVGPQFAGAMPGFGPPGGVQQGMPGIMPECMPGAQAFGGGMPGMMPGGPWMPGGIPGMAGDAAAMTGDYKEFGAEVNGQSLSIKVLRKARKPKKEKKVPAVCGHIRIGKETSSSSSSREELPPGPILDFCGCNYPLPPGFSQFTPEGAMYAQEMQKKKKKKKKKEPKVKCPLELCGNYCLKPNCPMGYPQFPSMSEDASKSKGIKDDSRHFQKDKMSDIMHSSGRPTFLVNVPPRYPMFPMQQMPPKPEPKPEKQVSSKETQCTEADFGPPPVKVEEKPQKDKKGKGKKGKKGKDKKKKKK